MTRKVVVLAGLALLVRVGAAVIEPLPISGDEIAHGNYIGYICAHHALPDSAAPNTFIPDTPDRLANLSYEFYQPPGYYVVTALLGFGKPISSRLVSVAMFMIAFFFVWAATRRAGNSGDLPVLYALAFIPGLIVTTSTIGNDVFLLLGSAIMLYACCRQKTWAFVLGGLVLATSKLHGLPILLVIGAYNLIKRNYRWAFIGLGLAVLAGGIIWWRWDLQVENKELGLFVPTVLNIAKMLHETLVTGFLYPQYDRVPQELMTLAVIGGTVLVFGAMRRFRQLPLLHRYVVLVVCAVWCGWCIFKLYPAGRYLFAAIPWLALGRRDGVETPSGMAGGKQTAKKR